MAVFVNGVNLQGLYTGTATWVQPSGTSMASYVSPNLQGISATHSGKVDVIPNQLGQDATLLIYDEMIKMEFDFFPQGTSSAEAKLSAWLPELGSKATITGLPVIKIGSFADGLNSTTESPWIYEGEGTLSGTSTEKWGGKITLTRRVAMTAAASAYGS